YPNDDSSGTDQPLYNYRVWRVNGLNTTNFNGQGVHGDITLDHLKENYAVGDLGRFRSVIWVADADYELSSQDSVSKNPFNVAKFSNYDYWVFSMKDKIALTSFLGSGGRLFAAGQMLANIYNHTIPVDYFDQDYLFYQKYLGIEPTMDLEDFTDFSVNNVGKARLEGFSNDDISDPITGLALDGALYAHESNHIDNESSYLSQHNTSFILSESSSAIPFLTYQTEGSGPTEDDGNLGGELTYYAGVRLSDGDDNFPYATVTLGFDFGSINSAGDNYDFPMDPSDTSVKGRNILMRNTLDYLRNPKRTATEDRLQVIYYAKGADPNDPGQTIVLPQEPTETGKPVQIHVEHGKIIESGGMTANTDFEFEARGGTIYSDNIYTWELLQHDTGETAYLDSPGTYKVTKASSEKIVYHSGSNSKGQDILRVTAPDGSKQTFEIELDITALNAWVVVEGDVFEDSEGFKVMSVSNKGTASVSLQATGGDGLSYTWLQISGASHESLHNTDQRLSGDGTIFGQTYSLGSARELFLDGTIQTKQDLSVTVTSAGKTTSTSFTLLAPVRFSPGQDPYAVVGGDEAAVFAVEGYIGDDYDFDLTDTSAADGTVDVADSGHSAIITATDATSTDPHDPDSMYITVESLDSEATLEIDVYNEPFLYYRVNSGSWINLSEKDAVVGLSDKIELKREGGMPDAIWQVISTDLAGEGDEGYLLTEKVTATRYAKLKSIERTYVDTTTNDSTGAFTVTPGALGGDLTLQISSGGSSKTSTMTFSPFTLSTENLTLTSTQNYDSFSISGSAGTYTATFSPAVLGVGFSTSTSDASVTTTATISPGTTYYFHGGDDGAINEQRTGTITVTDANNNALTMAVTVQDDEIDDGGADTDPPDDIGGDDDDDGDDDDKGDPGDTEEEGGVDDPEAVDEDPREPILNGVSTAPQDGAGGCLLH
ncbi:MAG: hypothetical protein HQL32_04760, partial [Planctomycetes bacterium]|nr:hypothetical protein [Planctomycetota bacterium]